MGAWQDRNGSLAGQKWEAWQKIICKTQHFESFSVIFVYFLPLLVGFCHTFLFFSRFCLFFSHLSSNLSISRTVWQDSLAEKLGTLAWPNTWPPWQEEISAGRDWILAGWSCWPPLKNDPDTPMWTGLCWTNTTAAARLSTHGSCCSDKKISVSYFCCRELCYRLKKIDI